MSCPSDGQRSMDTRRVTAAEAAGGGATAAGCYIVRAAPRRLQQEEREAAERRPNQTWRVYDGAPGPGPALLSPPAWATTSGPSPAESSTEASQSSDRLGRVWTGEKGGGERSTSIACCSSAAASVSVFVRRERVVISSSCCLLLARSVLE